MTLLIELSDLLQCCGSLEEALRGNRADGAAVVLAAQFRLLVRFQSLREMLSNW